MILSIKLKLKLAVVLLLTLIIPETGISQKLTKLSFIPKVGWNKNYYYQTFAKIDKYEIWNTKGNYGNYAFGVSTRLEFNKIYIEPEILYSNQEIYLQVYNPQAQPNTDFIYAAATFPFNRLAISPIIGYKPIKYIRIFASPVLSLNVSKKEDHSVMGHTIFNNMYDGYKPLNFNYYVGVGVDFWRITINGYYEGNLTKPADEIKYEGKTYLFPIRSKKYMLTIGYKIELPSKRKPK